MQILIIVINPNLLIQEINFKMPIDFDWVEPPLYSEQ